MIGSVRQFDAVKNKVQSMQSGLPKGVHIVPFYVAIDQGAEYLLEQCSEDNLRIEVDDFRVVVEER